MKANSYTRWLRSVCCQLSAEPVQLHYNNCQRGKVIEKLNVLSFVWSHKKQPIFS